MKTRLLTALGAATAAVLLNVTPAHAGVDACGDINVEVRAECEVKTGLECTSECTPVRFEAACAGKLQVECSGECNAQLEASCTGSCEADCTGRCDVDPGRLDCKANCSVEADAHCAGECQASANRRECEGSCKATFQADCDASCSAVPPKASCKAQCEASCKGSCKAEVNAKCQIDCQSEGYLDCKADLQGGCQVDCTTSQGGLFCDNQYVDYGNNLQQCVDALRAAVAVDVQFEGDASGECANGMCTGEAEGSASCAFGPSRNAEAGFGLFAAAAAFVAMRRRRRV